MIAHVTSGLPSLVHEPLTKLPALLFKNSAIHNRVTRDQQVVANCIHHICHITTSIIVTRQISPLQVAHCTLLDTCRTPCR